MKKLVLSSVLASAVVGALMLSGCNGSSGHKEISTKPAVDLKKAKDEIQEGKGQIAAKSITVDISTNGSDENTQSLGSTKVTMSVTDSNCTKEDPCNVDLIRKCYPNKELDFNSGIKAAYEIADAAEGNIGLASDEALRYSGYIKIDSDDADRIGGCTIDFEIGIKCAVSKDGTKYYLMDNDPDKNDYRVTKAAVAVKDSAGNIEWYTADVEYKAGKRILKNLVSAKDGTKGIKKSGLPVEVYVFVKQNAKQRPASAVDAGITGATGGTGGIGG